MSDEKRYIVIHKGFECELPSIIFDDPEEAQKVWGGKYDVYELGPEVREPDYGPLVEWMKEHPHDVQQLHSSKCSVFHGHQRPPQGDCDCGLGDTLKMAQIE